MRNKGFTLVELLATIVILALISGIGAVAYTSIVKQSEIRVYEAYENTMHAETVELLAKKPELMPKNNQTERFSLNDIKIEPIHNPRNNNDLCTGSYVEVTRSDYKEGTYVYSLTYKVCLICGDYNSDSTDCKIFEN